MFRSQPNTVSQTWGAILLLALGCFVVIGQADEGSAANVSTDSNLKDKDKNRPRVVLSPEREAAVLTFVRLHHAELEALLIHLKEARPKEYDKAVHELFRATERLGQVQDRDQDLYELELRMWKTQSRLQLLLARLQMGDSKELRSQIHDAVLEQYEVKVAMLERQEKRMTEQARKAQEALAKLQSDREKWIERQINMLTKQDAATSGNGKGSDDNKAAASEPIDASNMKSKGATEKSASEKSATGKSAGKVPERQDDVQNVNK